MMKVATICNSIVVAFSLLFMSSSFPVLANIGANITREGTDVTITLDEMQLGGKQIAPGVYEKIEYHTIDTLYPQDANPVVFLLPHQEYTLLTIAVSSKVNSIVKVVWDNQEELVLTNPQDRYQIMQGNTLKLRFTAYSKHQGVVRFLNDKDEVVLKIPYSVEKKSAKRNSLRTSGGVQYEEDGSTIKPSITVRYRQTIVDPRQTNRRKTWGFTINNTGDGEHHFNPRATLDYEVNW